MKTKRCSQVSIATKARNLSMGWMSFCELEIVVYHKWRRRRSLHRTPARGQHF